MEPPVLRLVVLLTREVNPELICDHVRLANEVRGQPYFLPVRPPRMISALLNRIGVTVPGTCPISCLRYSVVTK